MRTRATLSLFLALLGPGAAAAAPALEEVMVGLDQTGTPSAPPADAQLPPASAAPGVRRPVPRYDGRPEAAPDLAETLVWVPRAVLFPVHVVAEYGLRRPFIGAITWSEEHYVAPRLVRVFTSEDGKRGAYPYFLVDMGMRPRLGVVAYADSFGHPDNDLRLTGSLARTDVFSVAAQNQTRLLRGRRASLVLRAGYAQSDTHRFQGTGPDSATSDAFLFALRQTDASVALEGPLRGLGRAGLFLRFRDARFGSSRYEGTDRDLATTHGAAGQPALPPGWEGYQLLGTGAHVTLDSRSAETGGGSGVRVEVDGAFSLDPRNTEVRFGEWGAELAGFVDVSGHENVLGARVAARFQENAGPAAIPFTERIALGGNETMRGFLAGRMRGNSAFLAELQYRYAIWTFVDAELFTGLGNTFDGHLDGFRPGALFWTSGLSLRTNLSRDSSWGVGVALGSSRLDAADFTAADHVRLFAGLNQGF
jgi:hypothetical protein